MKKYIYMILTLLWMGMIFFFSMQNGRESKSLTVKSIDTFVSISPIKENTKKKNIMIDLLINPVRKCAHFLEFMILGVLILLCIWETKKSNHSVKIAFILCLLYACTDEFHQLFIPNRTARVLDIFIDTLGALTGILLVEYMYLKSKCKKLSCD